MIFLSDNLLATDGTAAGMKAAVVAFEATINFFLGRLLDSWPRDAPLRALTYLKPVGAVALVLVLVIDTLGLHGGLMDPTTALASTLVVLLSVFAPVEALGNQAFFLEAREFPEIPPME